MPTATAWSGKLPCRSAVMIEVHVTSLGLAPDRKTPVIWLRQVDGDATLMLLVGAMEAMSVSLVLNGEALPRPLAHDLMLMSLRALDARLSAVEISDLRDGIYYATLTIRAEGRTIRLDSRPADAVALALRARAPIYVRPSLLGLDDHAPGAEQMTAPAPQRPDAATDMARQMEARREADSLAGRLSRGLSLPHADPDDERRYRDLLRELEPDTPRRM